MTDPAAANATIALIVGDMLADRTPAPVHDPAAIDRAISDGAAIFNRALEHLKPKHGGRVTRPAEWTQQAPAAAQQKPQPSQQAPAKSRIEQYVDRLTPQQFARSSRPSRPAAWPT